MPTASYLDHAASSPPPPSVIEAMGAVWNQPGNPSSLHAAGRTVRRWLEEARESLAADLGAHPTEVVFTSGGTEANNLALLGVQIPGRERVAISQVEHPSVDLVRTRRPTTRLPVQSSGHLAVRAATQKLAADTALVSVLWVNNETGAVQPIPEMVEVAHRVGALAHSDAVQAFGRLPVNFAASGLDLLSVSAHKLGGPVGIGALVVKRGVKLNPPGFGGGQEAKVRSGTVPAALAVGFATAARLAAAGLAPESQRLAGLQRQLIDGVVATIPQVVVNTLAPASPAITNLTFTGVRADDVLLLLDAVGIQASTGSACTAGVHQPSEVLLAMGRSLADAGASLRFSFGATTTAAQVQQLVQVLPGIVERSRQAA